MEAQPLDLAGGRTSPIPSWDPLPPELCLSGLAFLKLPGSQVYAKQLSGV